MAEVRVPVTDLAKVWPEADVKAALLKEPRAKVAQVYYNLYGELIISGAHVVLSHDSDWFSKPLTEGIHRWLRHGRVVSDDGSHMTIED